MTGFTRDALADGLRFLAALARFLGAPMPVDAMRAEVRGRFAQREARFLDATRLALAVPDSAYARLLRHAGCASDEVAEASRARGVEGALAMLYRAGV